MDTQSSSTYFLSAKEQQSKPLSCLAFSNNGLLLAVGEKGHKPRVLIFDLETRAVVKELQQHQFGVACVAFSPNDKLLVSCGFQHDGFVCAFELATARCIASAKVGSKVFATAWEGDNESFVVSGFRLFRAFQIPAQPGQPLVSKAVALGEHASHCFIDCAHVEGVGTFAITTAGVLCSFHPVNRTIDRWVDLQMGGSASCLAVTPSGLLACGGASATVRLFAATTMSYVSTLPVANGVVDESVPVMAVRSLDQGRQIMCWYADRSLALFDVAQRRQLLCKPAHAGTVWDLAPRGNGYISCGADNSLRVWNAVTGDCERVIQVAPVDAALMSAHQSSMNDAPDTETTRARGEHGLRCLRLSDDQCHLALGDRAGCIRVLETQDWSNVTCIQSAHEGEVLSLDYSHPKTEDEAIFLASASRDRSIQVYDALDGYRIAAKAKDAHSASVTSIKFAGTDARKLLSTGADKSLVFHVVQDDGQLARDSQKILTHGTVYDLAIINEQQQVIVAAQDKRLNVYSADNGKALRSKPLEKSVGDMVKVITDPAGSYTFVGTSKKQVKVFETQTGNLVASCEGHSEMITALCLTADRSSLISASADGCIFVWRIAPHMVREMDAAVAAMSAPPVSAPSRLLPRHQEPPVLTIIEEESPLNVSAGPSWLPASGNPFDSPSGPSWLVGRAKNDDVIMGSPGAALFGGNRFEVGGSPLVFDMTEQQNDCSATTVAHMDVEQVETTWVTIEIHAEEWSIERASMEVEEELTVVSVAFMEVEEELTVVSVAFMEVETEQLTYEHAFMEIETLDITMVLAWMSLESESVEIAQQTPEVIRRQRKNQAEVEKTRERLAKMGLLPKSSNNKMPLAPVATENHRPVSILVEAKQEHTRAQRQREAIQRLEKAAQECATMYEELKKETTDTEEQRELLASFSEGFDRVSRLIPTTTKATTKEDEENKLLHAFGDRLIALVHEKLK